MTAYILGIDPGRTGALALMTASAPRDVACTDMPQTIPGLQTFLVGLPPVLFAVVERPFYPPKNGIRNVTASAESYGALKCALAWQGIATHEIAPAKWKAALGLPRDKAASLRMAAEFFPDAADQWRLVKHHGRAEAALIAWFGLRWAK